MEHLADPGLVTRSLGDLLDQHRSRVTDPVLWAIPTLRMGSIAIEVVLEPRWVVDEEVVRIVAGSTTDSDADAELDLRCSTGQGSGGTVLTTAYSLELDVRLPRPVVALVRPAIHRGIDDTVDAITDRIVAGIEAG